MTIRTCKAALAFIPAALALLAPATFAQSPMAHHPNIIQRHPTATGFAAGIATHHALKVAARNRKMHGQKLDFAQRHPTMSGIGAGLFTRHEIKAHTAH
ncbi:MAG: hypothetical protein ACRYFS_22470 [Janthinobacterium lividum]